MPVKQRVLRGTLHETRCFTSMFEAPVHETRCFTVMTDYGGGGIFSYYEPRLATLPAPLVRVANGAS
eukprot:12416883-Karenia_brevis.AAC.1